ncbi:Serpentine Receptor, class H [Caenorhabditis elegans]|uniref:Serpentine Receptor, class H n=1 Tax=Caenorhabditis elegans TaxID=6239 RepID=G5EBQ4_CAEEL|nr:Serpentine Receptor, class H [Caenorhabditis elegans]CAB04999.1 Serpentine Receptor, class H [Caenorhabditis elegans]|eukprot:NP_507619.1 Serpentine Receptor, class H [Caenorhabditis elegans]
MCSELPALNYFGSDTFYSSTLHVLTAIEIPIHIFGAYIIITKTPSKMQSVKRGLLFLHFAGAILDVYYSLIAAPVLTLPICAGYPLGISLLLGIPTSVQVYLGISFVGVIGVTIMLFFEDRYHRLVNGHRNDGEWCWWRILYLVIHYVLSVTYIAPGFFNIVDQDFAKSFVKIKIPCIPDEILHRPGYFVLAVDNTIPKYCIAFMLTLVMSQVFFYVGAIFWHLFHTVAQSQATNRLQKHFFLAICVQVFIPILLITFPVLYIVLAIWFGYYNQAATNIALLAIPFHGVLSTISMLCVHRPYREATFGMFYNKGDTSRPIWMTVHGTSIH